MIHGPLMKTKITLCALLALSLVANGQEKVTSLNTIKSNSISLGLMGTPGWPIGITYGQMLSDHLNFEIGAGVYSVGARFDYFITDPRTRRLNLYTGLSGAITFDAYPMVYLPVGISYFGKNNFQYGIDAGLLYSRGVSLSGNDVDFSPWFGLKAGYRFGDDLAILKEKPRTAVKNIISLNLGYYDLLIGVVYERLLAPSWGIEAGLGFISTSVGSKVYFPSISAGHVSFHTGVSQSWGLTLWDGYTGSKTYVPLGVNFLTKNNFRYSIDAGPQFWLQDGDITLGLSLRMGKAF